MFTLIIAVFVLYITYVLLKFRKPKNFSPGPTWYPFVGTVPEMQRLTKSEGSYHKALQTVSERYDSSVISLKSSSENIFVVFNYPTVKTMLTREEFEARPINFFIELRNMGNRNGLTIPDGKLWKVQRKFVVTHLRSLGLGKDSMEKLIRDEVVDLLDNILEVEGKETAVKSTFELSVLNVLWTLTTGRRVDKTDMRLRKLLNLLEQRSHLLDVTGGTLNHYPWLRFIAPEKSGYNLIQRINSNLVALVKETIDEHYHNWTEGRDDDIIYAFITEMKRDTDPDTTFTETQLVMLALDLFLAGSQITNNMLEYTLYAMIRHPEVQEKLRQCINAAFGKNEEISYVERKRVPYFEAVLSEIERFYHVMPITAPRRALKDTFIDNYFIPKNSTILASIYSVNFDKAYWKDPEIFRPERFLDANGELLYYEQLIPFGLGRRKCPGDALAKSALFTYTAEIIRAFKIVLHPNSPKLTDIPRGGITITPQNYTAMFIKQ